jgi:hypothetical protein
MTLVCRQQGSKTDMRIRYRLRKVPSKTCLKPLYLSVLVDDRHTEAIANGESRLNVARLRTYILCIYTRTQPKNHRTRSSCSMKRYSSHIE